MLSLLKEYGQIAQAGEATWHHGKWSNYPHPGWALCSHSDYQVIAQEEEQVK